MQDLMILERRKKIITSLFFLTWSSLTLWCLNMLAMRKEKRKKKAILARLETIISCSSLRHGGAAETLWSLPPKLDFDYQTIPHTLSKACSHCSHTFSFFFFFNFLIQQLILSPLMKLENYKITKFKRLKYLMNSITKVTIVFYYFFF